MYTAELLRQKAALCRRLAFTADRRRVSGRRGNDYLLELAVQFEQEAAQLERQYGSDKPQVKPVREEK
jgi:hypothetical protein